MFTAGIRACGEAILNLSSDQAEHDSQRAICPKCGSQNVVRSFSPVYNHANHAAFGATVPYWRETSLIASGLPVRKGRAVQVGAESLCVLLQHSRRGRSTVEY